MKKNKRGISLIVLIVTIIVIIILAAAVILTLSKNNPVESAREARFKEDVRSFQDELSMYLLSDIAKDSSGIREKITTEDMPSKDVMNNYIESFSSKYENKLGIYEDELVYYKPDEEVKNKVTEKEEKWLQDLGIKLKVVETSEELFEWGSDDPNNPEYYTLKKYIGSKTNVVVPKRCHVIGDCAFRDFQWSASQKKNITSITLQEGITYIGEQAFSDCDKLETIKFPDSLENFALNSFLSCDNLKSITIPPKVTCIPYGCFEGCMNLKDVILNSNLEQIDGRAFGDTGLINVNIPLKVNNINGEAFYGNNLINIYVDENNSYYTSIDGVLYSKDKKNIVKFPAGRNVESYIIDNNVEYVLDYAFYRCKNLKNIELGDKVKSIGDHSFSNSNIMDIKLSQSLEEIGGRAFNDCNNITNIELPSSLKKIGGYAFCSCDNLVNINIPLDLEEIGYATFSSCAKLSYVYLSSSIKKIDHAAFSGCPDLTIDCEFEETNIPNTWYKNGDGQNAWYNNIKTINYGVKRKD